jgi:hypothetical protein
VQYLGGCSPGQYSRIKGIENNQSNIRLCQTAAVHNPWFATLRLQKR